MDNEVQSLNAAIADDYSNFVYDPAANPLIDVERLFGQAALFGTLNRPVDVLDLACGTGVQLLRVADQVSGRLVGNDISPEPARMAQERLAVFGDRAKIICGDLLDLDAEALGQFDVIYNIGVIYVTPPPVQRKILELIGKCLRPGGVAVLSYHAGSMPAIRTNLHRLLSAGLEGIPPAQAVQTARERGQQLADMIGETQGADLLRTTALLTIGQPDIVFYHEVFNHSFGAMQTTAIARELAGYGLDFAWYLSPAARELPATSLDRSIAADVADYIQGQYRHALFARYLEASADNFASPQIRWRSSLVREIPGDFDGEQSFRQIDGPSVATLRQRASVAKTSIAFAGAEGQLETADLLAMEADIKLLWQHGLLTPLFAP
jgi:SAM-dependent methyltransferase